MTLQEPGKSSHVLVSSELNKQVVLNEPATAGTRNFH